MGNVIIEYPGNKELFCKTLKKNWNILGINYLQLMFI